MGKLQARAQIWAAKSNGSETTGMAESGATPGAPSVASGRLAKHISTLAALVDNSNLPTANTDDAVSEFDDRSKRSHAKAKVIEKLLGEDAGHVEQSQSAHNARKTASDDIESFSA